MKVELVPKAGNRANRWHVYQEIRGDHGRLLRMTDAGYELSGGTAWFLSSMDKYGEAIGATVDAERVNLGEDGAFSTNVMVKLPLARDAGGDVASCYVARAFGPTVAEAKGSLARLLSSPERLEHETEAWWNTYLNEVPHLETPDETLSKTFLWSWADFRVNKIDVPIGAAPPGLFNSNNVRMSVRLWLGFAGHETIYLLHDTRPVRDLLLFILKNTRNHGIYVSISDSREHPRGGASWLGYCCGALYKYILSTDDTSLLEEDIGGMTMLRRLEDALEAQLAYRDEKTACSGRITSCRQKCRIWASPAVWGRTRRP